MKLDLRVLMVAVVALLLASWGWNNGRSHEDIVLSTIWLVDGAVWLFFGLETRQFTEHSPGHNTPHDKVRSKKFGMHLNPIFSLIYFALSLWGYELMGSSREWQIGEQVVFGCVLFIVLAMNWALVGAGWTFKSPYTYALVNGRRIRLDGEVWLPPLFCHKIEKLNRVFKSKIFIDGDNCRWKLLIDVESHYHPNSPQNGFPEKLEEHLSYGFESVAMNVLNAHGVGVTLGSKVESDRLRIVKQALDGLAFYYRDFSVTFNRHTAEVDIEQIHFKK
ncbi:MAG TPA: hypothetical protein VEA59_05860 [Patescibacteria group bacterium]|nr:hypothetical protein [Patescibacteria group bacterium]